MHTPKCLNTAVATSLIAAAVAFCPNATAANTAKVADGLFVWPISKGFLNQAVNVGKGQVTTSGGARWNAETLKVSFPVTSTTRSGNTRTFALDGSAQIQGYKNAGGFDGWAVDVTYSDLKIEVQGTDATLIGDYRLTGVANKTFDPVGAEGDNEPLVTFTLNDAVAPPKPIAEENRTTFSDTGLEKSLMHYPKGTELKDSGADLRVEFDKDTALAPSSLSPGAVAGILLGVVAVLGTLGWVATQPSVRAQVERLLAS